MNYRALTLGAAIGFLVALSPSCGVEQPCGPANCNGCCADAKTCVDAAALSAAQCGTSGAACNACTGTDTCTDGACKPVVVDAGCGNKCENPDGTCSTVTCTTGCCGFSTGGLAQCKGGAADNACGKSSATTAVACANCADNSQICDSASRTCSSGTIVGQACATNDECAALGAGALCKLETTVTTGTPLPYPGGYCTLACDANPTICPSGSQCAGFGSRFNGNLLGETLDHCVKDCGGESECRTPDYLCIGLGGPNPACLLDPPAGPDVTGSACLDDFDCGVSVPPLTGTCIEGGTDAGPGQPLTPTGFPEGYCISFCDRGAVAGNPHAECGTNDLCVRNSDTDPRSGACLQGCEDATTGQGSCRAGYACYLGNEPRGDAGVCWPDCKQVGFDCSPRKFPDGGNAEADVAYCAETTGFCCRDFYDVGGGGGFYKSGPDGVGETDNPDGGEGKVVLFDDMTTGAIIIDAGTDCSDTFTVQ